MRLGLALVFVAGCYGECADPRPFIMGRVELAAGVDARAYATLEVRGHDALEPNAPANVEPVFVASESVAEMEFPHEFIVRGEAVGYVVHLRAWLAHEAGAVAARADEPSAKVIVELCECATHTPAFADDVTLVLRYANL